MAANRTLDGLVRSELYVSCTVVVVVIVAMRE